MQSGTGFRKITRAEFDRLVREQQMAYLDQVRQIHLANQRRVQEALRDQQLEQRLLAQKSPEQLEAERRAHQQRVDAQRRQAQAFGSVVSKQRVQEALRDKQLEQRLLAQKSPERLEGQREHYKQADTQQTDEGQRRERVFESAEQGSEGQAVRPLVDRSRLAELTEYLEEEKTQSVELAKQKRKRERPAERTRGVRHSKFSRIVATKRRRVLTALGIVMVVGGIGLFGANMIRSFVLGQSVDRAIWALLDDKKPVIIRQNGQYGYMDTSGKMIIDPKYVSAGEYYGEYAEVATETRHLIIDKKGNTKLELDAGATVKIDTKYGVWFIADKMYDVDLNPMGDDGKTGLTYRQRGVYTYKDASDKVKVASLRNKNDIYACEMSCTVYVTSAPDFIQDIYVVVNETREDGGSMNRVFNAVTGVEVYAAQDQLLVVKDKNQVAKSVNGNEEIMYLVGDKVAYTSPMSFEIYDQIKHVVKIVNTDNKTKEQYPFIYRDTDTNEEDYAAPVVGSVLTAFDESLDVQTCGKNNIGIVKNGGRAQCNWLSLSTSSVNVMEYLKGRQRLIMVGRTSAAEEFYNIRTGETYDQFDHISISSTNDELFVMTRLEDKWFVYSLVTGEYIGIPNVMMSNLASVPSGVTIHPSYFTVENKDSIAYYNHNMESFYVINR